MFINIKYIKAGSAKHQVSKEQSLHALRSSLFDSGLTKNAGFILLLVSLFILDDVLIYLLFKNIYDWKVDLIYFGFGATIVLLLNLGLALAVLKIMRKRPTTGQQGMIGKKGVVLKKKNADYLVRVQGEIWKSQSKEKLKTGDKVIVETVDGLSLTVKRTSR